MLRLTQEAVFLNAIEHDVFNTTLNMVVIAFKKLILFIRMLQW